MEFVIKPLIGLNDVKFGMKQKDVEKILGKPEKVEEDDIMEEVTEERNGIDFIYSEKKLYEICFNNKFFILKNISLLIKGIDICKETDIIKVLSNVSESNPSKEIKGYINFYGFGICLAGFGKSKLKEGPFLRMYPKTRIKSFERLLTV